VNPLASENHQVNVVPNNNSTFLDLVFTNAPVDVSTVKTVTTGRMRLKCGFALANLMLWKVEVSVICSG
jgi:hypothetical protein